MRLCACPLGSDPAAAQSQLSAPNAPLTAVVVAAVVAVVFPDKSNEDAAVGRFRGVNFAGPSSKNLPRLQKMESKRTVRIN